MRDFTEASIVRYHAPNGEGCIAHQHIKKRQKNVVSGVWNVVVTHVVSARKA